MKHKKLFITLTAILTVFVFLGIFILIWFVGDSYKDFKKFNKEFAIEGLDEGAIPQGITSYYAAYSTIDENGSTVSRAQQYFLVSAYMNDGSPSRIYVTGQVTGYIGFVTLKNMDGTPHYGHVGGIATNGARVWIADGDSVAVARSTVGTDNILKEIIDKAARNKDRDSDDELDSIQFTASFKANCNVAFLYYSDDSRYTGTTYDRLYVGEFYRKGNYETDQSHRIKTPSGYKNTALMYEYNIDGSNSENPYGLTRLTDNYLTEENKVPKIQYIYSIPEKIQGVAFSNRTGYSTNDGILVLSQSYGLSNSHLLCFDWKTVKETQNSVTYKQATGYDFVYDGVYRTYGSTKREYIDPSIKVYYVDKGNRNMFVNDYSIPSMSEGMCVVTPYGQNQGAIGRVYVLFESGSKKYGMFTRERIKNVYSFIPHAK